MSSLASASVQQKASGKGLGLKPAGGIPAPHNASKSTSAQWTPQPDSPSHLEGRSEYGSSAVGDSAPVVSSFDDPDDVGKTPQLGYKDELEVRFIWDRVVESNRKEGYLDRVVIDRYASFHLRKVSSTLLRCFHALLSVPMAYELGLELIQTSSLCSDMHAVWRRTDRECIQVHGHRVHMPQAIESSPTRKLTYKCHP
jgi:hypothetical protein